MSIVFFREFLQHSPTRRQILVEQCADGAREKHFAGSVAFALNDNGAIRPGNILNVDSQGFLATQAAIMETIPRAMRQRRTTLNEKEYTVAVETQAKGRPRF